MDDVKAEITKRLEKQAFVFAMFAAQQSLLVASLPDDQNRADSVVKRIEENKKTAEWRWLLTKAQALKDKSPVKS